MLREVSVRSEMLVQTGKGPLVAFLPSDGRQGAALLRIFNIAAGLRQHGWRTLVLQRKLAPQQRHRLLAELRPDILVMQGARHALNRPHLYPGYPIVYDMDDADFHLPHLADPVTVAMGQVDVVMAGSAYIADWCRGQGAAAQVVWTGMPVSRRRHPPHEGRPPVVAWAQTRPMTYVREADLVLEVMARLASVRPDVRLRLYDRRPGDDPAFAARFRAAGIHTEWNAAMALPDYLASFDDVSIGLAPLCPETPFSRGKSFGKILGYLDRCVPVIASDEGEHGRLFGPGSGIVSNDPAVWVAKAAWLLSEAESRRSMAESGFSLFRSRLSTEAATLHVAEVLTNVMSGRAGKKASRKSKEGVRDSDAGSGPDPAIR